MGLYNTLVFKTIYKAVSLNTAQHKGAEPMRLALKTATSLVLARFSLSRIRTVTTLALPLHSPPPSKTLLRTSTPSFRSCACAPISMAATTPTQHQHQDQQQEHLQVRDKIELSDIEKSIFDRLLATLRHFHLQTQLRVAGGWVRDKVSLSLSLSSPNCLVSLFV